MIFERMKDIREYFDKTQIEMANILKVSRSTYAGWENGIDLIPLLKLNEFCNYFGICLDYICGLTNTKKYEISNLDINKIILGQNVKKLELIITIHKKRLLKQSALINLTILNMN